MATVRVKIPIPASGLVAYPDNYKLFSRVEILGGYLYADYKGTGYAGMVLADGSSNSSYSTGNDNSLSVTIQSSGDGTSGTGGTTTNLTNQQIIGIVNNAITNNQISVDNSESILNIVNNAVNSGLIDISKSEYVDVVNVVDKVIVHNKNKDVWRVAVFDDSKNYVITSWNRIDNNSFNVSFAVPFTGRIYYEF